MSRDFFVADFEFTQYTKRMGRPRGFFSEIIEIGAVKIDGNSLAVTGKIQNFVHPHFYPKQTHVPSFPLWPVCMGWNRFPPT